VTAVLVSVRHSTHYSYEGTNCFAVQRLRLTPSDTRAQTVRSWSIEAEGIEHAAGYLDGFGNKVHLITRCKPFRELTITASGEVETLDTGGVAGEVGEANPLLFLNDTPLTRSSPAIDALADELPGRDALDQLHGLLQAVAKRVRYVTDATGSATTAAQAFDAGQGVCQDHAHIFIAGARRLGVPARYVCGYLHVEGEPHAEAHHAWAEAHLPNLGWVGFDPANDICPTERYVRLACGFDAQSAAPITGTRRGGGRETLGVEVVVRRQEQWQQQQ
jgi:transglutaminase-like putative cysteine protease